MPRAPGSSQPGWSAGSPRGVPAGCPPQRVFAGLGVAAGITRQGRWLRTGLVAVQVSAAVILVLGTGLFLIRALETFGSSIRFETRELATAHLNL